MKTQEQEALARAAVERFVNDLRRAEAEHELLDDDLGGENLQKTHGHKIGQNSSDDKSELSWNKLGVERFDILLLQSPNLATESGHGYLLIEEPLNRLENEALADLVRNYYAKPNLHTTKTTLRQKILDFLTVVDFVELEFNLNGNFIGFVLDVQGQPAVLVRRKVDEKHETDMAKLLLAVLLIRDQAPGLNFTRN